MASSWFLWQYNTYILHLIIPEKKNSYIKLSVKILFIKKWIFTSKTKDNHLINTTIYTNSPADRCPINNQQAPIKSNDPSEHPYKSHNHQTENTLFSYVSFPGTSVKVCPNGLRQRRRQSSRFDQESRMRFVHWTKARNLFNLVFCVLTLDSLYMLDGIVELLIV